MSEAEIGFVNQFVNASVVAVEWGSGGSTVHFGVRAREWISIEHNCEWAARVLTAVQGRENIHVVYAAPNRPVVPVLDDWLEYPEEYSMAFRTYINAPFVFMEKRCKAPDVNLVLVDGRARLFCALKALSHRLTRDATILVHDFRPRPRYWPLLERCEILASVESGRSMVALKSRVPGSNCTARV
jgi:hypothetical protein